MYVQIGAQKYTRGPRWPLSLTWLPDKSESIGILVQEKKFNIDFQDEGHLGFSNQNDFSYFWSTSHLDTSNEVWVDCTFCSGEKVQNRFSTWLLWQPSWILIRMILPIFDQQVTPILPIKFRVSGPFYSGEVQNRFSRWPYCISDRSKFSYFFIYKSAWWFLPSFKSTGLSIRENKQNIDFQDGRQGDHLGFSIGTILAILIYQSPLCFLPSFELIGLSVQEKRKMVFEDGGSSQLTFRFSRSKK